MTVREQELKTGELTEIIKELYNFENLGKEKRPSFKNLKKKIEVEKQEAEK